MITQQKVVLQKKPGKTYPAVDDIFQYSEQQVNLEQLKSQVKEGEMLVRVLYISCDAAMRVWISGAKTYVDPVLPGDVMTGQAVGEVVFSRSKKFKQGDILQSYMRWQNYIIIPQKGAQLIPQEYPQKQHFLGVLGISGLTAYFGFFDIGKPKKGETVVISAAAGAVGEIVVQLAKNHGCNVIAIAGTDEKCSYIKNTLGADHVINYKTQHILKTLREIAPQGVDVYFDNVGGQILDDVLLTINDFARVVMCGAISQYNSTQQYGIKNYMRLILKKSTMQGFIVLDFAKRYQEAIMHLAQAIQQGKMIFREDLQKGLINGSSGLQKLLQGKNDGKVIIDLTSTQPPKL